MTPGRYDLPDIWIGLDWLPIVITWKDGAGNPIDLTGKIPFAQTNGGINLNPLVIDAVNGVTIMQLGRQVTASFKMGDQTWDWIWWDNFPNGLKYPPFIIGNVSIKQPKTENFQQGT